MAPLDGLASETPESIVIIHAIQGIRFPAPIFKVVVLNDGSVRDPSLAEESSVSFLARHESTALIKYVLRHSMFEDHLSFELIQEEIYFANAWKRRPWIVHLCVGTTTNRALWISGITMELENASLMGCPLNHRNGNDPSGLDSSILEGA